MAEYENLVRAVQQEGNNVSAFIRDLLVTALRDKDNSSLFRSSPTATNTPIEESEEHTKLTRLHQQLLQFEKSMVS
jgi:hypothetical protein